MAKNTQVEVAQVERTLEQVMEQYKTKSAAIRALLSEGMSRGAVAKFMNIRYQHVRNVDITPIKKATTVEVTE